MRLPVLSSTELGSKVNCRVDVTEIDAVVWLIVEIGEIESLCVAEKFATDTLGVRSSEVEMLCFVLLLVEVTTVDGRLRVNASEKRVLFNIDATDVDLLTTEVCVSIGPDNLVETPASEV